MSQEKALHVEELGIIDQRGNLRGSQMGLLELLSDTKSRHKGTSDISMLEKALKERPKLSYR